MFYIVTDNINKTYRVKVPRRSFIEGRIIGKYRSSKDKLRSFSDIDLFYVLDVYEAQILDGKITREQDYSGAEDFKKNIILKQPINFSISLNGLFKIYSVTVKDYVLNDIELYDVVTEKDQSFGSITARIIGYIEDEQEIEVEESDLVLHDKEEGVIEGVDSERNIYSYVHRGRSVLFTSEWRKTVKSPSPAVGFLSKGIEDNTKDQNKDKTNISEKSGCLGWIIGIMSVFILVSLFLWFWPLALVILALIALNFLIRKVPILGRITNRVLSVFYSFILIVLQVIPFLYFLFILFLMFNSLKGCSSVKQFIDNTNSSIRRGPSWSFNDFKPKNGENGLPKKILEDRLIDENKNDKIEVLKDYWITNFISWTDYDGKLFSGYLKVNRSSVIRSHNNKVNLSPVGNTQSDLWNQVYFGVANNDFKNLTSVYKMYDSIRIVNNLNSKQFLNMVVSSIQSIDYVMILDNACDARLYNQEYIKEYLSSSDSRCQGYEKFGLNTPIEFSSNLKGDCDTRSLMLFTILTQFGYDVIVLNSDLYGHSVLGVNYPSSGVYKKVDNKKYYVWETTVSNLRLGELPKSLSNMKFWYVSIKNR